MVVLVNYVSRPFCLQLVNLNSTSFDKRGETAQLSDMLKRRCAHPTNGGVFGVMMLRTRETRGLCKVIVKPIQQRPKFGLFGPS